MLKAEIFESIQIFILFKWNQKVIKCLDHA